MQRDSREKTRRAVFVMGMMAVAGVLIWSKLRLATNIPRSAYAVPEQTDKASADPADRAEARDPDGRTTPGAATRP